MRRPRPSPPGSGTARLPTPLGGYLHIDESLEATSHYCLTEKPGLTERRPVLRMPASTGLFIFTEKCPSTQARGA